MAKQTLRSTTLICVLFLVAANALSFLWMKRLPSRRKLAAIRSTQNPNVLFVGNSLLDGRLNETAFHDAAVSVGSPLIAVNTALGGSQPQDQDLVTQYAVAQHPGMRALVVGFFDFQLTEDEHTSPGSFSANQLATDRVFSLRQVTQAYELNRFESLEMAVLRELPLVTNRSTAWEHVELLRRAMGQMGMPKQAVNDFGRAADFAALEAGSVESFDADCQHFLRDPTHFSPQYEQIFATAAEHHLQVVLLAMPISPYHRDRFYTRPSWKAYMAGIRLLSQKRGYVVVDATGWMPDANDFADNLHMRLSVVDGFSSRLGQTLGTNLR